MTQDAELRAMLLTVLKKLEAYGKRIKVIEDNLDTINASLAGILARMSKADDRLDRIDASLIQLKMSQNKDRSVTVHIPS